MPPAWTLRAWPPVYRAVGQPLPRHFEHHGTHVFSTDAHARTPAGQTMWVWPCDDGHVGVAWDWVQVSRGVVAMLDPMAVLTNLKLLGDAGEVLTAWQAARHLNAIVVALPWQREVHRALEGGGDRAAAPAPRRRALPTTAAPVPIPR
ncbi:hypothetical protein [Azohydromonas sediminis]|uniref:hypothetical protein n=1 Tax=Azohydromonas sediminis TaxID=2259674 RepID=UPI0013C2F797|nr:hypothetical protein [Azohydromonas sediminis]